MKFAVTQTLSGNIEILSARKDIAALAATSLGYLYPAVGFKVVCIDDFEYDEICEYYQVLKTLEDAQIARLFAVTSVTVNENGTVPVLEEFEGLGIYGRLGLDEYGRFTARTPEEAQFFRV